MTMKVLGGKNLPSYWERFDRLQRTAHKLGARAGHSRGVFRFKSFEAFNTWKEKYSLKKQDPSNPDG